MRFSRILMVSAAMTLAAGNLQAQTTASCNQIAQAAFNSNSCAVTNTVGAVVPYLATVSHSTASVTLPAATVQFMNNGVSASIAGPTLSVQSNFAYTITATSGGFAANGSYTKAKGDLEIATTDAAASFAPFVDAGVVVAGASSTTATPSNGRTLPLFFRVKYDWTKDLPGTYNATVTYTLTAP